MCFIRFSIHVVCNFFIIIIRILNNEYNNNYLDSFLNHSCILVIVFEVMFARI